MVSLGRCSFMGLQPDVWQKPVVPASVHSSAGVAVGLRNTSPRLGVGSEQPGRLSGLFCVTAGKSLVVPEVRGLRTVTGCIPRHEAHFRAVMEEQLRLERGEQIRIRRKRLDRNENDERGNGVTEVTPHLLKTQGFRHVLILLFYDHPAERVLFP